MLNPPAIRPLHNTVTARYHGNALLAVSGCLITLEFKWGKREITFCVSRIFGGQTWGGGQGVADI